MSSFAAPRKASPRPFGRSAEFEKARSSVFKEIVEGQIDVLRDLAEEEWRHVSTRMVRNSRTATVRVPILHV